MPGSADRPVTSGACEALDGLARLLLGEEDTQSVLQRVIDLVPRVVPAGAEASLTLVRDQRATTAAYSGALASELDESQCRLGVGPCMEAVLSGDVVEVTDARTEDRWPDYMPVFLHSGALSALAVPVPAAQFAACLNVYARDAHAFTDQHRRAVAEFAAYATVALANMDALQDARDQARNLRVAMESRAVIEQAKGILIERYKVNADGAFRLLAEASMRSNRKVRDLAEQLVFTGDMSS